VCEDTNAKHRTINNKVPNNIKKVEEYKPYKRKLKTFLTEHAFYSIDEFLVFEELVLYLSTTYRKMRGLLHIYVLMNCGVYK
jgi:hypothetical protein